MIWTTIAIVGVIGGALVLTYVNYYNKIQVLSNRIEEAWAQIDVQLQKRYDLLPNLVSTVKGYASHEKEIFEGIANARAGMVTGSRQARVEADNMITQMMGRLFAIAEAYPDLKAQENFKLLQEQMEGMEIKIAYARQFYNDTVLDFNNVVTTIPGVWFAGGRGKEDFLEIPDEARTAPKVEF
jgi:LemA protein